MSQLTNVRQTSEDEYEITVKYGEVVVRCTKFSAVCGQDLSCKNFKISCGGYGIVETVRGIMVLLDGQPLDVDTDLPHQIMLDVEWQMKETGSINENICGVITNYFDRL